jgi:hypothetical protein
MEPGLARAKEIDLKMLGNELTEVEGRERVGVGRDSVQVPLLTQKVTQSAAWSVFSSGHKGCV